MRTHHKTEEGEPEQGETRDYKNRRNKKRMDMEMKTSKNMNIKRKEIQKMRK